jgi:hypothetical protein
MKSPHLKLPALASLCFLTVVCGGRPAAAEPGCHATVYWDAEFGGEALELSDSIAFVGQHWNDQISSIVIHRGYWVFYWDADYKGEELRLGPGKYPLIPERWNDQISSARCVEPTDPSLPEDAVPPPPTQGEYLTPDYVEEHYGRPGHEHGPHGHPGPHHPGPHHPEPHHPEPHPHPHGPHGPPHPHGPAPHPHGPPPHKPPPKHH